jgi:hypothetical protein
MSASNRLKPAQIAIPILVIVGFSMVLIGFLMTAQKAVFEITPTRTGKPERCLTCHYGIEPISASHPTDQFGCVSCHGGDGLALDADAAHTGLVRNPSALDVAQQYCGECHSGQVFLVQHSLMATYAGAISLVRRAFGLQADGTAQFAVRQTDPLQAFVPKPTDPQPVQDFAANCLNCHQYAQPQQTDYYYRGTGCSSCHVLYGETGLYQGGDPTISKTQAGYPEKHQFTTAIPYTQCDHCHNRGNYDLRTMTFLPRQDIPPAQPLSGQEKRLHDYYQPISDFTRCEWELNCIDCHTSQEIMGDGHLYNNRSEAQYIQCSTCHGTLDSPPREETILTGNSLAMLRANLNPFVDLQVGDTILVTSRGEPLYHIRKVGGKWVLTDKASGTTYDLPLVTGSKCQQKPDQQASSYCHQCHSVNRSSPTP